jgi:hypothetical protein
MNTIAFLWGDRLPQPDRSLFKEPQRLVNQDQKRSLLTARVSLPHQYAHELTWNKGRGDDRRELDAIACQLADVALVDQMIHLFATADDPNLRSIVRRNGQRFIEF